MLALGMILAVFASESEGLRVLSSSPQRSTRSQLYMYDSSQTIVVTGLGVVSPSGNTANQLFDNICNGVSAISKVDRFDATPFKCQIAEQVRNFDPRKYYKSKKKIKQNDLSCHYAVAASHMALADAKLDLSTVAATRVSVIIGSAFGGMESFERAALDLANFGPNSVGPYTIPMILGNTPAGIVAMETGAKGPNFGVQTACATATHALGEAVRLMRNGDADMMIAGGTEAPLTPLSFAGFCSLMAMNFNYNDAPTKASRPFDLHRGGFVMARGLRRVGAGDTRTRSPARRHDLL
jgi:3-oxoacyl-[acyl-carrier-protein] synthase II